MPRTIPAGILGRYFAARHTLKLYFSCAGTGTYLFSQEVISKSSDHLTELLMYAMHHTIARHPALCWGVQDKTPDSEAQFILVKEINWDDIVELQTSDLPAGQEDIALEKSIGKLHGHLFIDPDRKPGWKVVVLIHSNTDKDDKLRVDVVYANHHAIGDGTSGASFQNTFTQYLYEAVTASNIAVSWPYIVPQDLPPLVSVEEAFPFPSLPLTPKPEVPLTFAPFAFLPPTTDNPVTLVRLLTLPASSMPQILTYCRSLKITFTGVLHAYFVLYLSHLTPPSQGLRASTPYTMRRFTNVPTTEIVDHIANMLHNWAPDLVSRARAATENTTEEEKVILEIAQQYHTEIQSELASIPTYGSPALLNIAKVKDMHAYCQHSILHARSSTYEISNVGSVTVPARPDGAEGVEIAKMAFTQSVMVAGEAIGCSVVSLRDGPLVISLSWQEGIVEVSVIEELKAYLEKRLLGLRKTAA